MATTSESNKEQTVPIDSASSLTDVLVRHAKLSTDRIRANAAFTVDWIDTPIGPLIAIARDGALCLLEFPERKSLPTELAKLLGATGTLAIRSALVIDHCAHALDLYFGGQDPALDVPLAPLGTPFEHRHWDALRAIPAGQTRSYGVMAQQYGTAPRAVGRANGANPIAVVIPCHRLTATDGKLTGYGGGLWRKRWLLAHEAKQFGRKDIA